jgi:hypothetical protein
MTMREAKEIAIEIWTYMAEHPEIEYKDQLPEQLYSKIERLKMRCPICEVFQKCEGCIMTKSGNRCGLDKSAVSKWEDTMTPEKAKRARAAKKIVRIISAWETE